MAEAYPRPGVVQRLTDFPKGGGGIISDWTAISAGGRYAAYYGSIDPSGPLGPTGGIVLKDVRTGRVELATVDSFGIPGGPLPTRGFSIYKYPGVSANGRYVVFYSDSPTLDRRDVLRPDPFDDQYDVFIRDMKAGQTRLISVGMKGQPANSMSYNPSISANGRYVSFLSAASNLVPGDTNDTADVFLYDTKTDKMRRVSVASDGSEGNDASVCSSLSLNGRYVVFSSNASNLSPGDVAATIDIFVHDSRSGDTERITREGVRPGGHCVTGRPISDNGRFVVFWSEANNLVPYDSNVHSAFVIPAPDIFVFDRKADRMERVSVSSAGVEAPGGLEGVNYTMGGISSNGRFVMFESSSNYHVPNDTEGPAQPNVQEGDLDVFVHDRLMGTTNMVAVDARGREGKMCGDRWAASAPSMSANGRYLLFASCSNNLVAGDDNQNMDFFLRDMGPAMHGTGMKTGAGGSTQAARGSVIAVTDTDGDGRATFGGRADVVSAKVAYRPQLADLYLSLDVKKMPGLWGLSRNSPSLDAGILYGFRFKVADIRYELRAQGGRVARMGLFRCATSYSTCVEITEVTGGYGTTGERIVFSVPWSEVGLRDGSDLSDAQAFSSIGTYLTGSAETLDLAKLRS